MALSPVISFDHSAKLPIAEALILCIHVHLGMDLDRFLPDHSQMDTSIPEHVPQNQVVMCCQAGR